jgi:outer membrane protein assembly factor BamB
MTLSQSPAAEPPVPSWHHAVRSPVFAACVVALTVLAVVTVDRRLASPAAPPIGCLGGTAEQEQQYAASLTTGNTTDWVRFNYDPAHSGNAPSAQGISAATVGGLRQVWRAGLGAVADSAPVYLHNLVFPDHSAHDVLYVDTKDGTLVAVDAHTGCVFWRVYRGGPHWTTSSPTADPSRRYVYFYGLDGFVHKVGATTGQEITSGGWPVRITSAPAREKGSAPLSIVNGRLYAAVSTYAPETPPNVGHLVVITLADASTHVFNTVCSNVTHIIDPRACAQSGAGIWARATPAIDPLTGHVFITTANAEFDGRTSWGDSVLELSADGTRLLDSYTPLNEETLDDENWDLGSTGPALLPQLPGSKTPALLVQGGKDGTLHLLNRQNLSGKGGPGHLGGDVQMIANPGCTMYTQPAVWQDPTTNGGTWVFTDDYCGMTGYQVVTDGQGNTRLMPHWHLPTVITTSPLLAGGVLFAASSGALLALDPHTGQQLWSSAQASAVGTLAGIHWESPIIVGGKVYVTDESGAMIAYGLP